MEYNKYECNNYNIYTIKTDKFKNCYIEIVFRNEIDKASITKRCFLCDILTDSSKKYPTARKLNTKFQELYNSYISGVITRVGPSIFTNYSLSFLDPKYTESKIPTEVIKLLCEMILEPNIVDNKFDLDTFNIVKNRIKADILAQKEKSSTYALKQLLTKMNENAPYAINVTGYLEDLEKITPKNLVDTYQEVMNSDTCDIFVVGNLDMNKIVTTIKKYFKYATKSKNIPLYIDNKARLKTNVIKEDSTFSQAQLVIGCTLNNLTDRQTRYVMPLYNTILGGGSGDTKLFKTLRDKNSLCYSTSSIYSKWDRLVIITAGIASNSYELATKLVKKSLKDMELGNITQEELDNSKKMLESSLTMAFDSPVILLNNNVFNIYDNLPAIEKRIKKINSVTLEEIINVAKKVKINTIYLLNGGDSNGGN